MALYASYILMGPPLHFTVQEPAERTTGVVFASPHSGRAYPDAMRAATRLDAQALRSSEDAYVDRLIDAAPRLGAPLLLAHTPRAYVDLNRSPDELDPAVIEGVRRVVHNPRVSSGLGVIPRVVANGRAIYCGKLSQAEARARIDTHWHPYHAALQDLMTGQRAQFGKAVLIDCHSMPHEAIEGATGGHGRTPEVVLGDRFGAACDAAIIDGIEAAFRAEGLRVARNAPFAGAFIAQRYGRPAQGFHVVQIEIDRALYMNEATLEPLACFEELRAMMARVMGQIVDLGRAVDVSMAAE